MASAKDAARPAFEYMRDFLFRPFDIGRWFLLGFLSFLQSLAGGCGPGGSFNFGGERHPIDYPAVGAFVQKYFIWIVVGGGALFVFFLVMMAVFYWLSSRGTFAYLDCVLRRKVEVARPWKEYASEAHSFFQWKFFFFLVCMAITLVTFVPFILSMIRYMETKEPLYLWLIVPSLVPLFLVSSVFVVINVFLTDFIVPLQLKFRIPCAAAWQRFGSLLRSSPGAFVRYLLFKILIALGLLVSIILAGCLSCCVLFLLLIIPVVGQALLQPYFVFNRAFPLYFLRQFGDEYSLFEIQES